MLFWIGLLDWQNHNRLARSPETRRSDEDRNFQGVMITGSRLFAGMTLNAVYRFFVSLLSMTAGADTSWTLESPLALQ
jgi:hypothetical protein